MTKSHSLIAVVFLALCSTMVGASELLLELEQSIAGSEAKHIHVQAGDEVTLVLSATNTGEAIGTALVLSYEWPSELEFVNYSASPAAAVLFDPDSGTVDWHMTQLWPAPQPGIQPGAQLHLTGRVSNAAAGRTLQGNFMASASDSMTAVDVGAPAKISVKGVGTADLSVNATGNFSRSGSFYNVTFDVLVSNAGPDPAAEVFLTLEIDPVTLDLLGTGNITGPAGSTCDVDLLGCIYFDLAAGETLAFTATGQVHVDDAPTNVPIDFVVVTNDADPELGNNRARGRVNLPAPADDGGGGGAAGALLLGLFALILATRARLSRGIFVLVVAFSVVSLAPPPAFAEIDYLPTCDTTLGQLIEASREAPVAGRPWQQAAVRLNMLIPLYGAAIAAHFDRPAIAVSFIQAYIRIVERLVTQEHLLLGSPPIPDLTGMANRLIACLNDDPDDTNRAPVANAGADVAVQLGQVVILDGGASTDPDGDPLTFSWTQVAAPAGSLATLSNSASDQPSFTVDIAGTYLFELVVSDAELDSPADAVEITTANSAPVADAGTDQTALVGDTVSLDASGSTDVDGDFLIYMWSLVEKPPGSSAEISDANALMPTIVIDLAGEYVAELIVNDGEFDSDADRVAVDTLNSAPVADAGTDQTLPVGSLVTLDGAGSFDVDGNPLTFAWELTEVPDGSAATLSNDMLVNPDFVIDLPGTYTASLVVNDGFVNSSGDIVLIATENSQPLANAGPDIEAVVGDTVVLDGGGSSDADADALTFAWSLLSGPSTPDLDGANTATASFVADAQGNYVVQLIVNDGMLDSVPDTSTVEVAVIAAVDSDGDGLVDSEEVVLGTDPNNPDTDGDGLSDGEEVNESGTSPLDEDTDRDGFSDGQEVANGSDPGNPNDFPDLPPIALEFTYDESRQQSAVLGDSGGELSLDLGNGVSATLSIPAGTVDEDTQFSMTPAVSTDGLPPGFDAIAAVRLGPADTAFFEAPQLTFTLPEGYRGDRIPLGFFTRDDGSEFYLTPLVGAQGLAEIDETNVTLSKTGFSTGGLVTVDPDTELNQKREPSEAEGRAKDGITDILKDVVERQLSDMNLDITEEERDRMRLYLDDWLADIDRRLNLIMLKIEVDNYTQADLDSTRSLAAEAVELVVVSQLIGMEPYEYTVGYFLGRIESAFDRAISDSYPDCIAPDFQTAYDSEVARGRLVADLQLLGSEKYSNRPSDFWLCQYNLTLTPESTELPFNSVAAEVTLSATVTNRFTGENLGPLPNVSFLRIGDIDVDYTITTSDNVSLVTFDPASNVLRFIVSGSEAGTVTLNTVRSTGPVMASAIVLIPNFSGPYTLGYSGTATQCRDEDEAGSESGSFPIALSSALIADIDGTRTWSLGGSSNGANLSLTLTQNAGSSALSAVGSASYSGVEIEEIEIDGGPLICTYTTERAFSTLSGSGNISGAGVSLNLTTSNARFSYTGSPAECGSGSCAIANGQVTLSR